MKGISQPANLQPGPFISYAREDIDFVGKLHKSLLRRGRNAWVDWDIFPSSEWMQEVKSAIDAAPAVVFLISPDSITSSVCQQELDHALAQQKRLIPVLCRNVDTDRVNESLRKLNWIHVLDHDALEKMIEQLIEVLDIDLDWVSAHSRLLSHAQDWESSNQERSLLLRGTVLKEFEEWLLKVDLDGTPQPTALQTQYVIASRRAQTTQQRYMFAGVSTALILTVALFIYAQIQSRIAVQQRDIALSRLLAAHSLKNSSEPFGQLDLALLLSVAAGRIQPTLEAQDSLFSALIQANRVKKFVPTEDTLVSLTISPDGQTIATGNFNGGVRLWDAPTLKAKESLQHGKGVVESLAFSPDGGTLASAGSGRIVLWDESSKITRHTLLGTHDGVTQVVWHPDGSLLFSGSNRGQPIFIWDVVNRTRQATIPYRYLSSLAVSPDGTMIASSFFRIGVIRIWDVINQKELMELHGHQGEVGDVSFSQDGALLASAGHDSTIVIWDVANGTRRMTLKGHHGKIDCVAFSPDGNWLVSGSNTRTIMLWDLKRRKPLELLAGHTNGLMNIEFTHDSKTLVSNAFNNKFIVWDLGFPIQRGLLVGHSESVRTISISPDGTKLASGSDDRTIRIWDVQSGQSQKVLDEHHGAIQAVEFSPDGSTLASGSDDDRRIILWDVATGGMLRVMNGEGDITSIAFSPDGKIIASGAEPATSIILWEVTTGKRLSKLSGHESIVNAIAFKPGGRMLVSGGREGAVRFWDLNTQKETDNPLNAGGSIAELALSPDGSTLVSATGLGILRLWNLGNNDETMELDTESPISSNSIAFSPNGRMLAYSAAEANLKIVIWDLDNAQPQVILHGLSSTMSMVFTPGSNRLITGHSDGKIALWNIGLDAWPSRACEISNRNLTHDEWKTFVGETMPYKAVCPKLTVP